MENISDNIFRELPENMEWVRIFWVSGVTKMLMPRVVKDPPCNGWQSALVINGEKRSTIFCPYSFESFNVPKDCAELRTSRPSLFDPDWFGPFMKKQWASFQTEGTQKDYDTAAMIWKKFGGKAPEQLLKGGKEDTRVRGGKEVNATLIKPVVKTSKRGKFLAWFIENNLSASIREVMAEFDMSRSNALSYLHGLNKDNGLGYYLVGDTATVQLPKDCENPFS